MGIFARHNGEWYRVDEGGGVLGNGDAIISSAELDDDQTPIVANSFIGNGENGELNQAYDVYEFTGTGTLNVTGGGYVDFVMIGGGGAGTAHNNVTYPSHNGGGGAGEVVIAYRVFVEESSHKIVIGAGSSNASNGSETSAFGYQAKGGGVGRTNNSGTSGGSGGGGSGSGGNHYNGGVSNKGEKEEGGPWIYRYGNDGGNGFGGNGWNTNGGGGGGGGAGGRGTNGSGQTGGPGGAGRQISFNESPKYYAGGGAGMSKDHASRPGGSGGGGSSSGTGAGKPGEPNTGSGGGAGWGTGNTVPGGSGIVIIRVRVGTPSFDTRTRTTAPRTAHAARIEDGTVRKVIVIPHLDDDDQKITEYCNSIGLEGTWVDTSYTGSRRGKYAGIGDLFDINAENAEFVSPQIETAEAETMLIDGRETKVKRSRKR